METTDTQVARLNTALLTKRLHDTVRNRVRNQLGLWEEPTDARGANEARQRLLAESTARRVCVGGFSLTTFLFETRDAFTDLHFGFG